MRGKNIPLTASAVKGTFGISYDYDSREILIGGADGTIKATVCYIDGLVNGDAVAREIIRPATESARFAGVDLESRAIDMFLNGLVYSYTARLRTDLSSVIDDLMNGFCAVIFDKVNAAVTFEVRTDVKRSIDEPQDEKVVKGSKDVFIEILKMNTMQVRRKLRNQKLRFKQMEIGEKTGTMVVVCYIEDYTNMELVREMERRIKNANIESALTAASIEEYIYDRPGSLFPQLVRTERPDRFCMNLLEGRVGLLIDGLPMGYLAPGSFAQCFKVTDDNAKQYIAASVLSVLRYLSVVAALLLPALYIAIVMYHQEMLPTRLLQSIINSRMSVPFSSYIEVLTMLAALELLQEAGLRLPNSIGGTVSIIGALIVGQSAVDAKIVSPAVVVVIAAAGVASYTAPNQDMSSALRLYRFVFVLASMAAGLFGLVLSFAGLVYHLCTIESFGISYMEPFAGGVKSKGTSGILRRPLSKTKERDPILEPRGKGRK